MSRNKNYLISEHFVPYMFQESRCMVFLLDDFHNVHTIRMPNNLKLSKATHMASALCDIHLEIPAIEGGSTSHIHSATKVTIKGREYECRGGIVKSYLQEMFTTGLKYHYKSFLSSLPEQCQHLTAQAVQKQIKQFRCCIKLHKCYLLNVG